MMLCDIVPCGSKVVAKKMCHMHYQRVKKHGNPYFVKKKRGRATCSEDGCNGRSRQMGLCDKHWGRFRRHGSTKRKQAWYPPGRKNPSYGTLHKRIRAARGSASRQRCVDCGETAQGWSYNHSGVEEYMAWEQTSDTYFPASNDIYQYDPRCKACHNIFDINREGPHAEGLLPTAP